ncbi:uncharacterized protein LOC136036019 isoform X3 [Artemia franciscana]|uniref:uncharacterized protein LOC136036019 isoform X3 n=1 Tax=Artemia franciscana TaxID=6661 RepID=UPI0032DBCD8E
MRLYVLALFQLAMALKFFITVHQVDFGYRSTPMLSFDSNHFYLDCFLFFFQQVKDEFAGGIDKGWNNSSSQFEVDGEHFDYGSEKVIENQILERTERKPEVDEAFPDFSEDTFGRKYPILSPKHEYVPVVVSPGMSDKLTCTFKPSQLESNIRENEMIATEGGAYDEETPDHLTPLEQLQPVPCLFWLGHLSGQIDRFI